MAATVTSALPRDASGRIYAWIAATFVLLLLAGFGPTYMIPVGLGKFEGPAILHIHGRLFFTWPLLFIAQATLATTGRLGVHRSLGIRTRRAALFGATGSCTLGRAAHRARSRVAREIRPRRSVLALPRGSRHCCRALPRTFVCRNALGPGGGVLCIARAFRTVADSRVEPGRRCGRVAGTRLYREVALPRPRRALRVKALLRRRLVDMTSP